MEEGETPNEEEEEEEGPFIEEGEVEIPEKQEGEEEEESEFLKENPNWLEDHYLQEIHTLKILLTRLFAISGYPGKAAGRFLGGL